MGEQAKNCHSIVFSYLIDKSQKLLQIPSCKSNLARYWSLILNDRLICFRVLLKEKIFSCLDFLIRTATRTANYQFCSLLDLHNAPKYSVFLLNQILIETKTAQHHVLAVSLKFVPPRGLEPLFEP